jgi:hypothetical protein
MKKILLSMRFTKTIHFSFLLIFLLNISAFCLTESEIESQVRTMVNDNGVSQRYTSAKILGLINIVQDDICAKTFALQKRYYISTSTGIAEYRLPSDCIQILRVAYSVSGSTSVYKRLTYTTIAGQDTSNSLWENQTGEPKEYYRRADYIGLKPVPTATYSGTNYIQMDYVVRASSLTNSTDVPFNGDYGLYAFHQAIVYGVVALCEYDKSDNAKYTTMMTIYTDWLNKIIAIVNNVPEKSYLNFTK